MISDWSHQWVLLSGGPHDMLEQQLEGSLGAWAMPHDGFKICGLNFKLVVVASWQLGVGGLSLGCW